MTGPVSRPLRRAARLVALEGVLLVLAGLAYGVAGWAGRPENLLAEELAALLAAVTGVAVVLLARCLGRARGWSRSPVVVIQLLVVPVGLGLLQGRILYAGAPLVLLGTAVLYQLATPAARLDLRG